MIKIKKLILLNLAVFSLSSATAFADDNPDNGDSSGGGAIPCHFNPVSCYP
ncbi:hypothetical protein GTG28_05875 [Vibrio sp. OCN044]|uniref:Uncharacterized protein n=1 Tax=Vibrio tetraodonis subsp. pristinus TaxID=2695891 RepID=A0A6L8LRM4_9VIBR|nr:hypothetical protein [Vibrio tetraodonis]MYM58744.1 hypothetical protein [Vibrio tetraodonis subsp. pristinus]